MAKVSVTLHVYGRDLDRCAIFQPLTDGWYQRHFKDLSTRPEIPARAMVRNVTISHYKILEDWAAAACRAASGRSTCDSIARWL
ncbi:MAG: hypothetical protein R2991_10645 [Thermoanaerobaculia bacterium]